MQTQNRVIIGFLMLAIVAVAAWSKLRHIEPEDHEPQRWPVDQHPAFRSGSSG